MLATEVRITYASLLVLERISAFVTEHNRFPLVSELGVPTLRGSITRSLGELEKAKVLVRKDKTWASASLTDSGKLRAASLPKVKAPALRPSVKKVKSSTACPKEKLNPGITRRRVSYHEVEGVQVRLTGKKRDALFYINQFLQQHGYFPSSLDIAKQVGQKMTTWDRARMVATFAELEKDGWIARGKKKGRGISWGKDGHLTARGALLVAMLPKPAAPKTMVQKRVGGGISADGGTLFKNMLFPADKLGKEEIIPLADPYGKLGPRVKKANAGGRQKGLKIRTWSLEEGRTCDPQCGIKDLCFAGKMSRQKRVLYEGRKTDLMFLTAISDVGPHHYRINTIGDIPTQSFLGIILAAITVTGSTAFGYTHWQPEHSLGAMIRDYSDWYWDFFSIRTSYEHGSREPLPERAAVVMEEFDPALLAIHNAIPCPEETGRVKNCGECGLCWTTRRNIAFKIH